MDQHPGSEADRALDSERIAYGVEESAHLLGVSRGTLFSLIRSGEVRSFTIGSRRLVSRQELERFVVSKSVGAGA